MSTITLPNIRVGSDLQVRVRLKDGGVAIDWSTLSNIKACIYSDAQRALAGRCGFTIDEEDNTLLVCTYAANKPQYLGVNRIVISAKYMGETKTYDKPAFSFVRWTADQEGAEITIDDPDVDVEIDVEDISSSILQEAVDAAFEAAERANDAAAAAEHMVDIHTGPEGKSAYEVAVEEGYTGTEEEWLASLKGDTGETPDISIGTVTTVAPGTPASASMTGTPEEPVLNLSIPQGVVGATPNFTVGTVTTGEPGSSVIVTITGTPEAPVLNLTIPQGMQGNTGSSVDYPYELVNNLTTNDATKGLSAAQGVVLAGQVSQLEHKVDGFTTRNYTEGYKVLQDGTLEEDSTSVVCEKVPVSYNDTITFNKAYSYICAYDSNDTKLEHWSARTTVALTTSLVQNVAYILASFKKTDLSTAYIKKGATTLWRPESSHTPGLIENVAALEDRVEELETSVENNTEDIATLNVKIDGQEQNYIPGKVMKSTGATEDEVTAFLSENIPVSQGDTIRFHQVYGFLCVFDSEGNRLDYWSNSYNDTDLSLSGATFANAAYMAASFKKTNKATATISKNGVVVFKAKEEVIGINEKLANKEAISIRIPVGGFITQSGTFKETQAGNTYTIFPAQRSWDVSAVSDGQAIFWISTGLRSLHDVIKGSELAESYEITLQEGEYLRIYVRGTQGQTLSFVSATFDKTQIQTNKEKIADLYHKFAGEDILDLHPAPVMEPILANLQYYKNPFDWSNYGDKPLTLLFFSDLHACSVPLQRIMRFANAYGNYIDDVVCGGDMVNSFNNGFDFWPASGAQKVLPVIGNHEVIGGSPSIDGHAITSYTKHSAKALYEMVVAPFLAQTGITVDEDKCYWYKDYDSCKIRVIALDIYHYNDTITVEGGATYTTYPDGGTSDQGEQATWFAETLAEAKTKNYAVVCLRHGPFLFDLMENPFTSMEFQNTTASGLINPANNSVVNMVQDFIDGGGVFLAWLTGHIHQDAVGTVKDFPDQFQMTIDTSRYHYNGIDGVFLPYGSNIKIERRTKAADCFDIFSVDTYKKNLTLFRIGSEYDRNGRHIGSLVYNYTEKRLIYVE